MEGGKKDGKDGESFVTGMRALSCLRNLVLLNVNVQAVLQWGGRIKTSSLLCQTRNSSTEEKGEEPCFSAPPTVSVKARRYRKRPVTHGLPREARNVAAVRYLPSNLGLANCRKILLLNNFIVAWTTCRTADLFPLSNCRDSRIFDESYSSTVHVVTTV